MLHFDSDYMEGAHPDILKKMLEINMDKNVGYGLDQYSVSAKEKIKKACNNPDAMVYFLVGGTQTNATVIDAVLRPYQGVIAAESGHINVHEAGAIEAGGHKVLTIASTNGKIEAETLLNYLKTFYQDETYEHMVQPGMVYISHPTELGTLYSKSELQDLYKVCKQYQIPLYMDGARLIYALNAENTDVTLEDISLNTDIFYIGGTKAGALFGEAVVVNRKQLLPDFFTMTKQHGALLAKGWLLGIQFDVLFTNHLYMDISKHAIELAMRIRQGIKQKGYETYMDSPTNQQFFIIENTKLEEILEKVTVTIWCKPDEHHTVIRLVTSFATRPEDVEALIDIF